MRIFYGAWLLPLLMAAPCSGLDNGAPPDTRCTMSVSSPFVDYGLMSRWQLLDLPGRRVTPGIRSTLLSVVCPHTRIIKLRVQGEINASGSLRYGEHGYTLFRLLDVQLDGNAGELRPLSPDGGLEDAAGEALPLTPEQRLVTLVRGQVAAGKTLTARLEIRPVLREEDARVSSIQRSESRLTLTLVD